MLLWRRHKSRIVKMTILIMIVIDTYMVTEFITCYVYQYKCEYPTLKQHSEGVDPVYAMVIADTHLFRSREGHWYDKWRQERQMRETFRVAMRLHEPEVVFVLGDLFEEGKWASDEEFMEYVNQFDNIFRVPWKTKLYAVVGNHDIGFHYSTTDQLNKRFENTFLTPPVQLVSIRGNHFVLINSIAMEGDGCSLCNDAKKEIDRIGDILRCTSGSALCKGNDKLDSYSRPIIMQHYPLYRESDSVCGSPAPEPQPKFRERWDCLSREATDQLVETLTPRAVFGAHTHHECDLTHTFQPTQRHKIEVVEYTVPPFSQTHFNDPKYYLLTITPDEVRTSKCTIPTVNDVNIVAITYLVVHVITVLGLKVLWGGEAYLFRDIFGRR